MRKALVKLGIFLRWPRLSSCLCCWPGWPRRRGSRVPPLEGGAHIASRDPAAEDVGGKHPATQRCSVLTGGWVLFGCQAAGVVQKMSRTSGQLFFGRLAGENAPLNEAASLRASIHPSLQALDLMPSLLPNCTRVSGRSGPRPRSPPHRTHTSHADDQNIQRDRNTAPCF